MQFGLFGLGGYPIGKFSYADGSPLGLGGLVIFGHHQIVKIDLDELIQRFHDKLMRL